MPSRNQHPSPAARPTWGRLRRAAACAAALGVICAGGRAARSDRPPRAEGRHPREFTQKAEFLYRFVLHVEWPAEAFPRPDSPVVIGVLGPEPLSRIVAQTLQGRTIGGPGDGAPSRAVEVRHVKWGPEARECHVLYVPGAFPLPPKRGLALLQGAPVLTVGETPEFIDEGGIVSLVSRDRGRLGFEVNEAAAKRARLAISSKLLRVAVRVIKDPR